MSSRAFKINYDDPILQDAFLEYVRDEEWSDYGAHTEHLSRAIIKRKPQDEEAYGILFSFYIFFKKHDRALKVAQQAIAAIPDHAVGYTLLASVYAESGRTDEALDAAMHARARAHDYKSWMRLAAVFNKLGNKAEIAHAMEQGLQCGHRDLYEYAVLAAFFEDLDEPEKVAATLATLRTRLVDEYGDTPEEAELKAREWFDSVNVQEEPEETPCPAPSLP